MIGFLLTIPCRYTYGRGPIIYGNEANHFNQNTQTHRVYPIRSHHSNIHIYHKAFNDIFVGSTTIPLAVVPCYWCVSLRPTSRCCESFLSYLILLYVYITNSLLLFIVICVFIYIFVICCCDVYGIYTVKCI